MRQNALEDVAEKVAAIVATAVETRRAVLARKITKVKKLQQNLNWLSAACNSAQRMNVCSKFFFVLHGKQVIHYKETLQGAQVNQYCVERARIRF